MVIGGIMRKIIYIMMVVAIWAGTGCAQTQDSTEQVYRDMAELRRQMARMQREIKAFVDEVATPYANQAQAGVIQDVRVDITDSDNNMIVKADLPGMEKSKLDITLDRGKMLKIAGTREYEEKQTAPGMVRQERSYGHFERVVELPSEGMPSGIKADYKDGVLEITIPKKITNNGTTTNRSSFFRLVIY